MAGAFITTDFTTIADAESVTGWSGDTFTLENEIFVQNANSVACIQTANGVNDAIFTIPAGSWDMSGSHLRMYMSSNIMPNTATEAANGIQMFAGDGTNTAYWTVGGSDTYSGGWQDVFVDVDSTPTSGSVNTAAVTFVGIRINTVTKPRNSTNGWYDYFRFGNGITLKSTTTEAFSFQDAADFDVAVAQAWGILQETDGVLFGKGRLTIGHATANTNLVSNGETIYFIDRTVSSTLYGLTAVVGTGTTDIDINAMVCKTVGASAAEIDFSAATTSTSVTGSTFIDMGTIKFASGNTIDGNTFSGCQEIDTNNANMSNCTITGTKESTTGGLIINSSTEAANITDMNFKNYPVNYAIHVPAAVTSFTMDNWVFDDPNNTTNFALYWAGTGGTLTISSTNGTNLALAGTTSAGGTIAISQDVSVNITDVIIGSAVRVSTIDAQGDESTNLINEIAVGTTVSTTVNFAGLDFTDVVIKVRSSSGTPKYEPYAATATILTTGLTTAVNQVEDSIAL